MVSDHDNRIVAVNPAFVRQTGYSLEQVAGENPRVLASGRTPQETYAALWAALQDKGYWQGELWERNRNGRIYPKWTIISVIRDAHGAATHFIASFNGISERKVAEERIEQLTHRDSLTGLFNRYNLVIRLSQAPLSAHRENHCLAVLLIDLDHFKVINDMLGRPVGDQLLVEVAQRLLGCVRESDIIARQGGDEFVVVAVDISVHPLRNGGLVERVGEIMRRYQLAHDELELETTESVAMSDPASAIEQLDALRRLGVMLTIDDSAPAIPRWPT